MAPYHNVKPENTIKRAEDLIGVGENDAALEKLYDLLTSRRARSAEPELLEPVALLFVRLAVQSRKTKVLRDGLHQYKKAVALHGDSAWPLVAAVCKAMLTEAQSALDQAAADAAAEPQDDDLEGVALPEAVLLAAVQADLLTAELVVPWLRLAWDSFRTALDVLRHQPQLETAYAAAANAAFAFCVKHGRRAEFRRLCDTLRAHEPHDPHGVRLDLQFAQLAHAVRLGLWLEAFRAAEDVHALLATARRPPKPHAMLSFYENVARVFWVADDRLFHAAAQLQRFRLYTLNPAAQEAELARLATAFSVAAAAATDVSADEPRAAKFAALLGLPRVPTRAELVAAAAEPLVLRLVPALVRTMLVALESKCKAEAVVPGLAAVVADSETSGYIKALTEGVVLRVLARISLVYEEIAWEQLVAQVLLGGQLDVTPFEIEMAVVKVPGTKINHHLGVVRFGVLPVLAEGPEQGLDAVRLQLVRIAEALRGPEDAAVSKEALVAAFAAGRALQAKRRQVFAKRQELRALQARDLAIRSKAEEKEAQEKAEEARKKAAEQAIQKRAQDKLERERQAILEQEKKKLAAEINAKGIIKIDESKLGELDADKLRLMQVEQLAKDKSTMDERVKAQAKRMDHIERANRRAELPLLAKDAEAQHVVGKDAHAKDVQRKTERAVEEYKAAKLARDRLARVVGDYELFKATIDAKNETARETLKAKLAAKLAAAKQERIDAYIAEKKVELKEQAEREARVSAKLAREAKFREEMEQQQRRQADLDRAGPAPSAAPSGGAYVPRFARGGDAPLAGGAYVPRFSRGADAAPPRSFERTPARAPPAAPASLATPPDFSKMTFAEKMAWKRANGQ